MQGEAVPPAAYECNMITEVCSGAPELRLCAHGVCSPELHSVYCGLGLLVCGQVAAHHLVLVVLVATLRSAQSLISEGHPSRTS